MPGLLASINFGRDRAGGCDTCGVATGRHQWYEGDLDYDGTVDDDDVTLQSSATSGPVTSPLSPPPVDAAAAVRDDFYYNESWQLVETYRSTAGAESRPYEFYIYDSTYIDAPILRDRDSDNDGVIDAAGGDERLYYLHDANWNTTALVDGTDGSATEGQVVERYAYDAYGRPAVYDASWTSRPAGSAYDNPIQFAGYHFDAETGLMLARHRFYNSSLGTWENRDPIGYGDGANLLAYLDGNPACATDPSGLAEEHTKGARGSTYDDHTKPSSPWLKSPAPAFPLDAAWQPR